MPRWPCSLERTTARVKRCSTPAREPRRAGPVHLLHLYRFRRGRLIEQALDVSGTRAVAVGSEAGDDGQVVGAEAALVHGRGAARDGGHQSAQIGVPSGEAAFAVLAGEASLTAGICTRSVMRSIWVKKERRPSSWPARYMAAGWPALPLRRRDRLPGRGGGGSPRQCSRR